MHSRFASALLFLLFASQGFARVGVAVENVRLEKDARVAFVRLINESTQDITALNMTVDVVFQNGSRDHFEHTTDLLRQFMATGSGAIHAGDRYEVRLDLHRKVASITAKPDVVVYADLAADVDHNSDALDRIVAERKSSALAAHKAAEVINEAAGNSVTPDPRSMALRQLRILADQAKKTPDVSEMELRLIISDLENQVPSRSKDMSSRDALKEYALRKTKDAETESARSLIRRAQ
ncbi:MAG: hypothetical protein JWQ87_5268 [Candidatus Sulfotelmatobacter sp.]|nr:hypothetical protein [Candidatus Sulfotelmatobacter sp.]